VLCYIAGLACRYACSANTAPLQARYSTQVSAVSGGLTLCRLPETVGTEEVQNWSPLLSAVLPGDATVCRSPLPHATGYFLPEGGALAHSVTTNLLI